MNKRQLKTVMDDTGLRQLDVANMFDLTPRQVRRWQKNEADVPVAERIVLRLLAWGLIDQAAVDAAKRGRR